MSLPEVYEAAKEGPGDWPVCLVCRHVCCLARERRLRWTMNK